MERSRKKKNYIKNNKKSKKEPIYYGIHLEISTEEKSIRRPSKFKECNII